VRAADRARKVGKAMLETPHPADVRLAMIYKATDVPVAQQQQLARRKTKQKRLSEASAVLGLTALGTKLPHYAAAGAKRLKAAPKMTAKLSEIGRRADTVSEHVVPLSLGVGAAGSINFARLQGQEAKQAHPVAKSWYPMNPDRPGGKAKHARVGPLRPDSPPANVTHVHHVGDSRGKKMVAGRDGIIREFRPVLDRIIGDRDDWERWEREARGAYSRKKVRVNRKSDYALAKAWREHVSEGASNAHQDLGQRRRRRLADMGAYGTLGAATGALGGSMSLDAARGFRRNRFGGRKIPMSRKARVNAAIPGAAWTGLAALAASGAYQRGQEAHSLQVRRNKIKAKGQERELASKAFGITPGGIMRTASGKVVTRRGGLIGTGRFNAGNVPLVRRPPALRRF